MNDESAFTDAQLDAIRQVVREELAATFDDLYARIIARARAGLTAIRAAGGTVIENGSLLTSLRSPEPAETTGNDTACMTPE